MRIHRKLTAWLLVLACLFGLVGCAGQTAEPTEAVDPTQSTVPSESEVQNPEPAILDGVTVETAAGLTEVSREDTESGVTFTSENPAGEPESIRLNKEFETVYGHYYELVYTFTSNVAGKVRFVSDGAAYYESNEYDVAAGENEIAVRFAAGQGSDGKVGTSLELGGLDKFELHFTDISCTEQTSDKAKYFLDVAPENASGTMETTSEGHMNATYKTEEGWRVKLAADRSLVKGKTYETTFVFLRNSGKDQNVTYTVYDSAATVIGSRTKWVDSDLCVATFYLTANETVTKGTCLELGNLSGGEEASLTFTYVDFKEVDADKLATLLAANPFPGVSPWTEASLIPATAEQSAEGLCFTNTNAPAEWWKVKLEQELNGEKDHYYRVSFVFDSNAAGKIKFINDGSTYANSNEYDVRKGENTFAVELKYGGNSYSCLELGGLGPCELNFTKIKVEEIEKPTPTPANRFASFRLWTDASVQKVTRGDAPTLMTLISLNEPADWWKIKLEKDLSGEAGQCYEITYKFNSDTTGRVKFVNDDAVYFGSNEYDVVEGENTFTVQVQYGGKPYSCLELGGLGKFTLMFTDYSIKEIEKPEVTTNGFESYAAWTEASMKPLDREDTANSMILTSENEPGDWWKVKLENNFDLEAGKTYEAAYTFTSDAEGDIKFGTNENVICHTADVYYVTAGENQFKVTFTAQSDAYTCLEMGGLGQFRLEFTSITLTETEAPVPPAEHTHSFVNGVCECGANNGFAGVAVWTEGSLTPVVRDDTANSMIMTSDNAAGDWWKVKLENSFALEAGKTYEAAYTFTSDAEGDIKFGTNENVTCHTADVYYVTAGENQFKVTFTAQSGAYTCLEMGGLGQFRLEFTSITLTETEVPVPPAEHIHSFVNGICECGTGNGFAGVTVWTEGSLTPVTRQDTENSMIMISDNAAADWWKVKLEWPVPVEEGKTYEVTFYFTCNVAGTIKYSVNSAAFLTAQEYNVVAGANTFTVRFTAGAENYSCLELGGLGAFQLTLTSIALQEVF